MPVIVLVSALVTLAMEVFYTRLFAALFWRNTAFAILSLAMLGIGASGVLVYLRPSWFPRERRDAQLAWQTIAFGLSIVGSYLWILSLSARSYNAMEPLSSYAALVAAGIVPFFFGGLVLSIVFTHAAERMSELYRLDLLGASIGAVLVLPALRIFNGPALVPVLALAAAVTGTWYAKREALRAPYYGGIGASVLLLALGYAEARHDVLAVTHSHGQKEQDIEIERWDPLARLTVQGFKPDFKWLNIDSQVVTPILRYSGNPQDVEYLRHNVLQLAYHLRTYPKVLIIGPGGGSDVLSAITFGNQDIEAVEVNRSTIQLMKRELGGFNGNLYTMPFVDIHIADGRAYVSAMDHKVDLLQATFVDTFTASASGSHTLSENYLYTVDGFHDFLDHLNPGGVLSMSRWGGTEFSFAETHRAIALAVSALSGRHVPHPEHNVVVVQGAPPERLTVGAGYQNPGQLAESMSTLLVKMTPFTDEELDRVSRTVTESSFRPLWLGKRGGADPMVQQLFLASDRAAMYRDYHRATGLDITPVTDDRPFFFDMIDPLASMFSSPLPEWRKHIYYFARTLDIAMLHQLLIVTSLFALGLLVVPLLGRLGDLRGVARPVSSLGYFVCLGIGYIGIELTLMQRFSLFLEHPIYSMVVLLSSILYASGLGSASTGNVEPDHAAKHAVRKLGFLVATLAAYGVLLPRLTRALIGLPLLLKMVIAVAVAFPPAYFMGMMLPLGIAAIRGRAARLVPWAWGLSSAFSVLGGVASLMFAMSFGYTKTWYLFAAAYALALVFASRLARVS
jgi:spermidine synthase